jgi:hypothetical protein
VNINNLPDEIKILALKLVQKPTALKTTNFIRSFFLDELIRSLSKINY